MEIVAIVSLIVVILLLLFVTFLMTRIKGLMEVEKNYTIMTKNYSTVTILQEIMVILGNKIPSNKKLERINEILINRFDIAYSTIVERTEQGNIIKATNVPSDLQDRILELDGSKIFNEAMCQNFPKYVTGLKTLEYPSADERDVRSALMFPLYREDEYRGFWLLEDIRGNTFDNGATVQLSIIKDNITLVIQNNDYAVNLENKTAELEVANKKLEEMANRDGLTGAFNKAFMHKKLDEVFRGNRRSNSIAIMDIDYFKNYNDKNGHMEGDNLLKMLSQLITDSLREDDMLFRFGGEEFVILFSDTERKDAVMVAQRIRQKVADFVFPYEERQPNGDLTISVGVASSPDDATEKQRLLEIADERLYKAKSNGRNQVVGE